MFCQNLIKSWSSTQIAVPLSSCEAEFYGVAKAFGMGLGYQAFLVDLGCVLPIRVWTDSSATMGICWLVLVNWHSSSGRPSAASKLKTTSSICPTALLNVHPSSWGASFAAPSSSAAMMTYGCRWFPTEEYEGMQVPEAYPHDPEILPHQHENSEELFPKTCVPHPADADEMVSEPDPLETKGGYLGRVGRSTSGTDTLNAAGRAG